MLHGFIKDSKLPLGVNVSVVVWPCDGLATCPGCTLIHTTVVQTGSSKRVI